MVFGAGKSCKKSGGGAAENCFALSIAPSPRLAVIAIAYSIRQLRLDIIFFHAEINILRSTITKAKSQFYFATSC